MRKFIGFVFLALTSLTATADSFDLHGITFKPGHPVKGESLVAAVVNVNDMKGLEQSATALRRYSQLHIEIAGHVDQYECQSLNECEDLGLRRALVVYRHLLDLGVNPKQIVAIREFGSARPIASDASEAWVNSRTELNIYSDP